MTYSSHTAEPEADHTIIERRDPLVGATLDNRFRIDARLAAGGFGAIYQATELVTGREVALKVLHATLTVDPLIVARFRREGATLGSLRSPHTVTAFELGEAPDGTLYIVMELLRGQTLHDAFRKHGGPLPWRRVTAIARAVCSSLAEAHEKGIVHRDLKPANIHLQEAGGDADFVKVLDFGIAKILRGSELDQSDLTHAGQMIGTFDYMAPEQMLGGAVGARCDIYTLGLVMYEMITGRLPFADATSPTQLLAQLLTTMPPPMAQRAAIPPALDRVVMRCIAREPQDRFENVIEVAAALDLVLLGASYDEPTLALATREMPRPMIGADELERGGRMIEEPTMIVQPARGSSPALPIQNRDGRGSQPPMRSDGRASQPRMRAQGTHPAIDRGSQPPMRVEGSRPDRGSQPLMPPVNAYEATVPVALSYAARVAALDGDTIDQRSQPALPQFPNQPRPTPHPHMPNYPKLDRRTHYEQLSVPDPHYADRHRPAIAANVPDADPNTFTPRVDARGSHLGINPGPYPVMDTRGSHPMIDPRALADARRPVLDDARWRQMQAVSAYQTPPHVIEQAFDVDRDRAVRRIVWVLAFVLGMVMVTVIARML